MSRKKQKNIYLIGCKQVVNGTKQKRKQLEQIEIDRKQIENSTKIILSRKEVSSLNKFVTLF